MTNRYTLEVSKEFSGIRADAYLVQIFPSLSRSALQKLIEQELVIRNNQPCKKNEKIKSGDRIVITIPEPEPLTIDADNIPLDIVYEDDDLLVVNKPKGMVVHPAAGNFSHTLVNALLYHCGDSLSGINGIIRPGIVHRIDKDTSGLLIVAKSDAAHRGLAQQIQEHDFLREYEAVAYGNIKKDEQVIHLPIARSKTDRKKMCVSYDQNARDAITHCTVLHRYRGFTHVRCRLETGRTHQIRVHLSYIGHSLAGDAVYGPRKAISQLNGQCLHAKTIGFVHPITGRNLYFDSTLPAYFTDFLRTLQDEEK